MKIKFNENVVYDSLDNYLELQQKIIEFIWNGQTDKILYKGDPKLIEYKLLKRIIPKEKYKEKRKKTISSYVELKTDIRETFYNFINTIDSKKCIIYKIK